MNALASRTDTTDAAETSEHANVLRQQIVDLESSLASLDVKLSMAQRAAVGKRADPCVQSELHRLQTRRDAAERKLNDARRLLGRINNDGLRASFDIGLDTAARLHRLSLLPAKMCLEAAEQFLESLARLHQLADQHTRIIDGTLRSIRRELEASGESAPTVPVECLLPFDPQKLLSFVAGVTRCAPNVAKPTKSFSEMFEAIYNTVVAELTTQPKEAEAIIEE